MVRNQDVKQLVEEADARMHSILGAPNSLITLSLDCWTSVSNTSVLSFRGAHKVIAVTTDGAAAMNLARQLVVATPGYTHITM